MGVRVGILSVFPFHLKLPLSTTGMYAKLPMSEYVADTRSPILPDSMPSVSSSKPSTPPGDASALQARESQPRKATHVWNNLPCGKADHLRLTFLHQPESSGSKVPSATCPFDGGSESVDTPVSVSNEPSGPSASWPGQDSGATTSTPGPNSDQEETSLHRKTYHPIPPASAVNTDHEMLESEQAEDSFIAKQHPCCQGTDPIMKSQLEEHQKVYQQHLEAFRTECENLVRRLSAAASEFIMPGVQPGSRNDGRPGPILPYDELDSTVNTMTTTVTTMINMIVTQIVRWGDDFVKNEGKIAVTETHLEEFLSHLPNTLSQMTNPQHNHSALLKDSSSVCPQLEPTSLVGDKDGIIASLRAEVAQIPTLLQDYATLQRDSSTQIAELQERCDVLTKKRDSVRKELHDSETLIGEREREVGNLNVEVERLKQADTSKTEQLDIKRKEKENLSSQISTLQERCDLRSKEVVFLRIDLQSNMTLLREREHKITTLTAKCDKARHENETRAKIIATAHQHVDQLQQQLTLAKDEKADLQKKSKIELDNLRSQMEHLRQNPAAATSRNNDPEKSEAIWTKRRYEEETNALKIALESSQSQLRAVQRVIATADVHADEAIIHVLKKLNAEIQQNTTFMAEGIAEQFQQTTSTPEAKEEAKERASKTIGQTLADYLANMEADEAALYLSIAFQACFSCSLCQIISSWTNEEGQNDFIDKIYEKLRETGKEPNSEYHRHFRSR